MTKEETKIEIVIDAQGGILGRIASYAAKQALLGKKVVIVNCEQALIAGRKQNIVEEYQKIRRRGGSSLKGPFFPKDPERVMKRTVRGMLSYTQQRGLDAFKRVMCYNQVPKEYEANKKITFVRDLKTKTISLAELEKVI
ncbi:MAG: 50S ribosomal protein L13 [Nanoarchaeota archaeon]|nr:50S ribosomal protein L13 [Nanoarchaeota archaeon]